MTYAAIFLLSLLGFTLLLLGMQRHYQDWRGRKLFPTTGRALRLSGFAVLAVAFVVAGAGFGWGYGAVTWFGWLTVAAALVVVANINRGQVMRKVRR
jgi:uncharacterized membrane protein